MILNKEIKLLLVEDNAGDIFITLEAFKEANIKNKIDVVTDGQAALDFLWKRDPYKNETTPDLILLDINIPKINGIDVLSEIKNSEKLKIIPVVMLTTSDSERDILSCYQNHSNCYITKPNDFVKYNDVIQKINDFWISTVRLLKT